MRTTTILLPAIMLATMSGAHAQEAPGGAGGAGPSIEAPSIEAPGGGAGGPALDRGPGPDAGPPAAGPGAAAGDGPRAAEPGAAGAERSAERPARDAGERGERGPSRKAADTDRGNDEPKTRRDRRADDDAGDRKPEKAAERDRKTKEPQERATEETGERAKAARDSAAREDGAKQEDGAERRDAARTEPERAKAVDLAGDKRDRVGVALRDRPDVRQRTNVDIDISVGRRLPRDWDFAPVPVAVVEIVPEYRDYVYVWVEDEYVICDPDTYEVVAVIPASGRQQARAGGAGDGQCSTRITLSADERDLILRSVRERDAIEVANLDVGWSVPADIELERFPEPVLAEASELSGCRYFLADEQLAIVDPEQDRVVLLIDRG